MEAERFIELKEQFTDLKENEIRLKGQLDAVLERLKDEFGFKDFSEASKFITKESGKITKLKETFDTKSTTFEDKISQWI